MAADADFSLIILIKESQLSNANGVFFFGKDNYELIEMLRVHLQVHSHGSRKSENSRSGNLVFSHVSGYRFSKKKMEITKFDPINIYLLHSVCFRPL